MSTTPAAIDLDTAQVSRTIHIAAPRTVVWAALTSPEHIRQWFGQPTEWPDGIELGATGCMGDSYGAYPARVDVYQPIERFAFTWGKPGEEITDNNSTTATFDLTEDEAGTTLTVVETGFERVAPDAAERHAAMKDHAEGWTAQLDDLTAYASALRDSRSAVADFDNGTITRSVLIARDLETTWSALTSPAAIEAWWGHPARFPDGMAPGSLGTFEWKGRLMPMRVEEFEPNSRFALTWGELDEPEPGPTATVVTFTLVEADPGRTLLTVLESGFTSRAAADRRAAMEENVGGWNNVLDALARYVDRR